MLVKNENNEWVELSAYANEILTEGLGDELVTEEDAQNALAELYLLHHQEQEQMFLNKSESSERMTIERINRGKLLEWLRKIFCSIIKSGTFNDIIERVIEAIAGMIPFGRLLKELVKKIIKYFLQLGIDKVCPA